MTVSGINVSTAIGVVGGEYSIGGGAYTSGGGTVGNGATVTVRLTASATPGGPAEAVLTIGGVSATFRATTSDDVTPPTAAIIFPPRVARTGGSTIMVRGTATGSLTDTEDPDNPIDTPNALAYDSATQIAYVTEWNFAAVLAVDLVTGRRAYLSH